MAEPEKKRSFLLYFKYLAILLIAVAIAGEWYVRSRSLASGMSDVSYRNLMLSSNPDLQYELRPFSLSDGHAVNKQGRRDFDYPRKKLGRNFRIAVMGDSLIFGDGVNVEQTFPKKLEYDLNEFQKNQKVSFQVFNYGVPGYDIRKSAFTYRHRAKNDKTDLAVLAFCLNDPDPLNLELPHLFKKTDWADEQFIKDAKKANESLVGHLLYDHSQLFPIVKHALLNRKQMSKELKKSGADLNKLADIEAACQKKKAEGAGYFFEVAKQNWGRVVESLDEFSKATDGEGIVVAFPLCGDLENYPYLSIHQRLAQEAQRKELLYIDLFEAFREAARLWPDRPLSEKPMQLTALGYSVAALKVADQLAKWNLLPLSTSSFAQEMFDPETAGNTNSQFAYKKEPIYVVEKVAGMIDAGDVEGAVALLEDSFSLLPDNPLLENLLEKVKRASHTQELQKRITALEARVVGNLSL